MTEQASSELRSQPIYLAALNPGEGTEYLSALPTGTKRQTDRQTDRHIEPMIFFCFRQVSSLSATYTFLHNVYSRRSVIKMCLEHTNQ